MLGMGAAAIRIVGVPFNITTVAPAAVASYIGLAFIFVAGTVLGGVVEGPWGHFKERGFSWRSLVLSVAIGGLSAAAGASIAYFSVPYIGWSMPTIAAVTGAAVAAWASYLSAAHAAAERMARVE